MSILNKTKDLKTGSMAAIIAGLMLGAATPLAAQNIQEDVKDVAQTPLEDVGLSKEEISEVLLAAAKDPYAATGTTTCNGLVGEIAKLDMVLGEDYDLVREEKTGINGKKMAKSVVGSIIPFRSIVREISGAAGDSRKAAAAVRAGLARRSYLKGLGQGRGCQYPARPKGS